MTGPGDEMVADAASGGRLPVCSIDREQVVLTLKAARAQGRLTEDEYDARAAQASASRSHAELAALTADLPAGLTARQPAAGDVWTGIGVIIASAGVLAVILLLQPGNALAFLAFMLAAVALIVTPIVTVGLMLDVRHQKHQRRSGRQLPP